MPISVSTQFDRSKISREQDYVGHMMVSIKAEDKDLERTPVSIVLVLDVSGSMGGLTPSGQTKIEAMKDTARKVVENLTVKDEIAIITFTDNVDVVSQLKKVENKELLFSTIAEIKPKNNTNLSGALLEGIRQVNNKFEGVQRVMVLTDGLPTAGDMRHESLKEIVSKRDSKTTMSFFGFGTDCDTELLATLAKLGGGNYYYISDGRDIGSVFAKELGGITACMAQNIQISVKPSNSEVLEVLNDYTVENKEGVAIIKAEDIYAGEVKHIVVKMKVEKPNGKPKDRPFSVSHVEVSYDDMKTKNREKSEHNIKVEFVKEEEADKDPVLAVHEQVALLEAAKKHREAVRLANAGDFKGAEREVKTAGGILRMACMAGSQLAGQAMAYNDEYAEGVAEGRYCADFGNDVMQNAAGMMKHRATSGAKGMAADYYGTSGAKKMEDKFSSKPHGSPNKPDPVSSKPQGPNKSFEKKRSRD